MGKATVALSNLSQKYDGTAKTVTVTTNPADLALSLTYAGSATPPTNAGSYAVVATVTDPYSAGTASGTLVIAKAAQKITFSPLAAVKVGDPAFALGATADSGLTVSYTSSNAAVATVSGNTVTIVGKGTTTITAQQAGNANYLAAPNVAQTLTVPSAGHHRFIRQQECNSRPGVGELRRHAGTGPRPSPISGRFRPTTARPSPLSPTAAASAEDRSNLDDYNDGGQQQPQR